MNTINSEQTGRSIWMRTTALVAASSLLTGCAGMTPMTAAALAGGASGVGAGAIARSAGMGSRESILVGLATAAIVGTLTYNYVKREATARERRLAVARAAEYRRETPKAQRKNRYLAVNVREKSNPVAGSSVVLFDTQTNQVVGSNAYDVTKSPKDGQIVKFDSISAQYVAAN